MSGFRNEPFGALMMEKCAVSAFSERAQLVLWVMHQQTTPEVHLLAPLRGKCRFMMCANTQMAYFQLHHPSSRLLEELLADLMPEHSEDLNVASVTSRLAALC